jgi:hypothetical protein
MFKQALYVPRKRDGENIAAHADERTELSKKESVHMGFRTSRTQQAMLPGGLP